MAFTTPREEHNPSHNGYEGKRAAPTTQTPPVIVQGHKQGLWWMCPVSQEHKRSGGIKAELFHPSACYICSLSLDVLDGAQCREPGEALIAL